MLPNRRRSAVTPRSVKGVWRHECGRGRGVEKMGGCACSRSSRIEREERSFSSVGDTGDAASVELEEAKECMDAESYAFILSSFCFSSPSGVMST